MMEFRRSEACAARLGAEGDAPASEVRGQREVGWAGRGGEGGSPGVLLPGASLGIGLPPGSD